MLLYEVWARTAFVVKADPKVSWTHIGMSPLIGARSIHPYEKAIDTFQCIRPMIMYAAVRGHDHLRLQLAEAFVVLL